MSIGQGVQAAAPGDRLCVLGTGKHVHLDFALTQRNNCEIGAFPGDKGRVWAFADIRQSAETEIRSTLLLSQADFSEIGVFAQYADGTWEGVSYDPGVQARAWQAGGQFRVNLPRAAEQPVAVAIRYDDLHMPHILQQTRLVTPAEADEQHYGTSLLFVLFFGIVTVPILYNIALYGALRERFMIWHALVATSLFVHALSASGLIYLVWPDLPASGQYTITLWSLATTVLGGVMFCMNYLEPHILRRWEARVCLLTLLPVIVSTLLSTLPPDMLRAVGQRFYFLSFTPLLLLFPVLFIAAILRGSRAARFLAFAWTAILLAGIERVVRATGLYAGSAELDMLLYFALAIETIVVAAALADRFLALRRDRDRADTLSSAMKDLSETDSLTGLPNRRAMERIFRCDPDPFDAIAMLDVDNFKAINDTHGHMVGDTVLQAIGQVLQSAPNMVCGRYGGEEFILLLRGDNAGQVAERRRQAITSSVAHLVPGLNAPVTASCGLLRFDAADAQGGDRFGQLIDGADRLLYSAKKSGRNRLMTGRYGAQAITEPPTSAPSWIHKKAAGS